MVAACCAQSSAVTVREIASLGAELLRLDLRAAGQRLTRDAGRKAEIVLDLRARAGLAAGRVPSITIVSQPSEAA